MTLDSERIAFLTGKQMFLSQIDSVVVDRPINNFIEFSISLNTGDLNLVLQSKVAVVDNTEFRQLVCTTRLPENFVGGSIVLGLESKGLTLRTFPICAVSGHFKSHIQFTGLDLIYRCRCGVGEPRKGGANEHCHAHKDSQCAGNQCPLGGFAACHHVFPPYYNISMTICKHCFSGDHTKAIKRHTRPRLCPLIAPPPVGGEDLRVLISK